MVDKVAVRSTASRSVGHRHRHITQRAIEPSRASLISTIEVGPISVVPDLLKVVIDDVTIHYVRVCRAVAPPYFVIAFIGTGIELVRLRKVNVCKDVLTKSAWKRLHTARIDKELIHPHPIRHVIGSSKRIGASDRNVVFKNLEAPHIRWAEVLHRVRSGIRKDQNFLSSLDGSNYGRTVAKAVITCLVSDCWRPRIEAFLIGPADLHWIKRGRCVQASWVISPKSNHETRSVRDNNKAYLGGAGTVYQRATNRRARFDLYPTVKNRWVSVDIPVVHRPVAGAKDQVLTKIRLAPQAQLQSCTNTRRSSKPPASERSSQLNNSTCAMSCGSGTTSSTNTAGKRVDRDPRIRNKLGVNEHNTGRTKASSAGQNNRRYGGVNRPVERSRCNTSNSSAPSPRTPANTCCEDVVTRGDLICERSCDCGCAA